MENRLIKRCIRLFIVLLLCLTVTPAQALAITKPNTNTISALSSFASESLSATVPSVDNDHGISPSLKGSVATPNLASYDATTSTQATSTPDPRMPTSNNCIYSFQNIGSGLYTTSTDNYLYFESRPNIYQVSDNSSMSQHFRLVDAGDGYYYIVPLGCDGSESKRMCAVLPNNIGFVENVLYEDYSENSQYEFRWRIEFIETPDNRLDCFAIFLGDSNYVLTAMTNGNGSSEKTGTASSQPQFLTGNICVTSYGYTTSYLVSGYTFTQEHQHWKLSSGQQELFYGYNVRNASTIEVCTTEINLHISCPVTQYGDTCNIATSPANILDINSSDFSVLPGMMPGYTILIAYTYDSSGSIKEIMTRATYVYLPNGSYYFSDISNSYALAVSNSSHSYYFAAYDGNEPTQNTHLYTLHYVGSGKYCVQSGYNNAFVLGIQENELTEVGIGIISDYSSIDSSLKWTIEKTNDGYRIYNVDNNYLSLTIPAQLTNGSLPYLSTRSYSNTNQLWNIQRALFLSGNELPYTPTLWNDPITNNPDLIGHIQYFTNCYNYAYNNQTLYALKHESIEPTGQSPNGSMQPGILGGIGIRSSIQTKNDLLKLLEYDKSAPNGITLIKANAVNICPEGGYRIALWYDTTSNDYHWYRQNSDGTWSHKPGDYKATNVDTHGNLIVDAYNQNTLYSTFVGYYYAVPFNVISPLETAPSLVIDAIGFYPDDFS